MFTSLHSNATCFWLLISYFFGNAALETHCFTHDCTLAFINHCVIVLAYWVSTAVVKVELKGKKGACADSPKIETTPPCIGCKIEVWRGSNRCRQATRAASKVILKY